MKYRKDVKAIYENSFCMDNNCIHYFEDMCMLCMQETEDSIQPYNLEYINKYGRGSTKDCESYAAGSNLAYIESLWQK